MTRFLSATAALLASTSMASAIGLDRSGQPVGIIFEDGNYAELSLGFTMPDVTGTDEPLPVAPGVFLQSESGNVAEDFTTIGAGIKYQYNDQWSVALIADQPYGSDIDYPENDGEEGSLFLGGTKALVESSAITLLGRYEFDDNYSIHGGIAYQTISADVTLQGAAYGGLSGYNAEFEEDSAIGYVLGVAYERPEIALRVALTYRSEIDHDLETTETLNGAPVSMFNPMLDESSNTEVTTPESLNLDFQTGIAEDTLLFGSIRYARYESTIVSPTFFDSASDPTEEGSSLTDIESGFGYTLGVGRAFTEQLRGSVAVGYEPEGDDDLVSPLAPTNGSYSLALGASYDVTSAMTLSGGVRYTWLGDAMPATADTARADFEDNDALSIGLRVGYSF